MSQQMINVSVKTGSSYTVPAGNRLVGHINAVGNGTSMTVSVNGVAIMVLNQSSGVINTSQPIYANAGDVISCADATGAGITAQLFNP